MREEYKKFGFLSLAVLLSVGLVGCNFNDNDSKTGNTMSGSNFGSATINDNNDSDNPNEVDDTSNESGDSDGDDDKTNDSGNSDGGNDSNNGSDNSGEGGTDNNGNSNGENGGGTGTAGCVNFPRPVVGQKTKTAFKAADGTEVFVDEETVTAISDTSITTESTSFGSSTTTTDTFTIDDNFLYLTKSTITNSTQNLPGGIELPAGIAFPTSTDVITYEPYIRSPINSVCEGDVGELPAYTETSQDGVEQNNSANYTIEAVNVPKTTAAGTFNTFRGVVDDGEGKVTFWIDTATGVEVVKQIDVLSNPSQSVSIELIEIN